MLGDAGTCTAPFVKGDILWLGITNVAWQQAYIRSGLYEWARPFDQPWQPGGTTPSSSPLKILNIDGHSRNWIANFKHLLLMLSV